MHSVPRLPRWLGLAGLLPQIAFAFLLWTGTGADRQALQMGALVYAAVILSFLGGAWWGIASAAPAAERRQTLGWLWSAAVLPSLLAAAAFIPPVLMGMTPEPSLVMLGAAILISLGVDAKLGPLAPRWWMILRVPLSLGLGAATLAAAMA